MNLIHPLKYHYYSYRKPYLIYLVIFIISLFLAPLLLDNLNDFYYFYPIAIILVTLGFTIINSIYEFTIRSEEHTSELQSRPHLVCRLLLEKKTQTHSTPESHV